MSMGVQGWGQASGRVVRPQVVRLSRVRVVASRLAKGRPPIHWALLTDSTRENVMMIAKNQHSSGGMGQRSLKVVFLIACLLASSAEWAAAQGTAFGEIEGRAAPVGRRKCVAGANAGSLCKQDADCPGSTCQDRNVFNLSVAVQYDASAADLTAIQNLISAGSAALFDVTDGQAEIGQATIHNNAASTARADVRIYPATCTQGASIGAACNVHADCADTPGNNDGYCGVWWWAGTGGWKDGGSVHVSINFVLAAGNPGGVIGHELVHLIFDARDEYENSPGCAGSTATANCPDVAAIAAGQDDCLMDSNRSELCYGQGDPAHLTDMTGGNHDATNVTEQSECRDDRSCWDQVVWAWPTTFRKPAAAPDPAAGGAAVNATHFISTQDTVRVVLVLDESGSMDAESPKRIQRLKVAAKDFVALAEDGTELGIVSYASNANTASGRAEVAVAPLGANRATWNNAIDGLAPSTRTNIGAGLQKARNLIMTAGGVTANTYIVLMSDGLNNEPSPQATADADLAAKIAQLLADGIPVYVTCTGTDLGLASQCSEIATGTNGFYVDSADPARMPEAFAELRERTGGYASIGSAYGQLGKAVQARSPQDVTIPVERGSQAVSFVLQWTNASAQANMVVREPNGTAHDTLPMPQGRFLRVSNPAPGDWRMEVQSGGATSPFVARAFARHPGNNVSVAVRYPTVIPTGEIFVYAYPADLGRAVTSQESISATVTRPDGSTDTLVLQDRGRDPGGRGDDVPGDGIFTGVYRNTALKGPYQFLVAAKISDWVVSEDAHEHQQSGRSSTFARETRLSAAVGDATDIETTPEDPSAGGPSWCDRWRCVILVLLLLLVLLDLLITWRCCRRARSLIATRAAG